MQASEGQVVWLGYTPERGQTISCDQLIVLTGEGAYQDRHADALSPRQILLTRLEENQQFGLQAGQLFENVCIAGLSEAQFKPGRVLKLGHQVELDLHFYCEPCHKLKRVLPNDITPKALIGRRGILATVRQGGTLRYQDTVSVSASNAVVLPDDTFERFIWTMERWPMDETFSYGLLARKMGVSRAYCRAMPGYFRRAMQQGKLNRCELLIKSAVGRRGKNWEKTG